MAENTKAAFGIYPKQRAKPSSKETKEAAADAAQFAAEMMFPQSLTDAGLMLIPGGKVARKAGAALIAIDAGDAEAGSLSALKKFRDMIRREAPEQANQIREALLRTQQTGREHSVIGLANEGGESVITRGTNDSVLPNTFDLRTAKRAPGSPTIVDFHTHPGQGYSIFETAPSRKDFEFYATEYPSKAGRDLRTMIAVPPTRDGARRTTSYNFFETQDPARVFDPRTLDAARFEMQRAGGKGSFKSIQDDPALREYFDYGGDLGSILEDAAPLALMRYRAGQGLGRHELQLGGSQLAPSPGATDVELFRQLEGPALEILKSKKFAEGGSVTVEDLFRKYQPTKGVPLSSDVIRWANKFGQTVDPSEEQEFADYYNKVYGSSSGSGNYVGEPSSWDKMTIPEKAAYYDANPMMSAITGMGQKAFGMTSLGQLAAYANPQAYGEAQAVAKGFDPSQTTFGRGANSVLGMFGAPVEAPMSQEQLGYGSNGYGFSDPMNDGGGSKGPMSGESWGETSSPSDGFTGADSNGGFSPSTSGELAKGGSVRMATGGSVSAYDPFQVDEIMNSINAPQNYAQGGSVSAYDPDRVDAIANQFM